MLLFRLNTLDGIELNLSCWLGYHVWYCDNKSLSRKFILLSLSSQIFKKQVTQDRWCSRSANEKGPKSLKKKLPERLLWPVTGARIGHSFSKLKTVNHNCSEQFQDLSLCHGCLVSHKTESNTSHFLTHHRRVWQ